VHNANTAAKGQPCACITSELLQLLQDNCAWSNNLSLPCVIGVNVQAQHSACCGNRHVHIKSATLCQVGWTRQLPAGMLSSGGKPWK